MNRRKFLQLAGIGTLVVSSLVSGCSSAKPIQLEEFVNFPTEIPEAERVEKFPVEKAKYCLVHIRQRHHIDYNPNDPIDKILGEHTPTRKELENINSHQKSIYNILEFLVQQGVSKSVYLEGIDSYLLGRIKKIDMTPKDEELIREVEELERKAKQQIIYDVPEGKTFNDVIEEHLKNLKQAQIRLKEHREKFKYFYGGGLRLVLEGKIDPKFEDLCLNHKAYKEIEKGKLGLAVFDDREDDILKTIAQGTDRIAVVEFGGAHAWGGKKSCGENYSLAGRKSYKDNIAEWNKAHPEQRFCLVEITPRGYVK